jgi:diguanylate cyclase (GGDEF)-like protein/PAS domain S-box-containing protein
MRQAYEELQVTYEELVATEEELIDQKKFNDNIFMDAHAIIATWDKQGRIKSINPFGQDLLGYTEKEIYNKKWSDLFLTKEKRQNINYFKLISQGEQYKNYESQFITKNNKIIDILWNNNMMSYQNKPDEILSIGTDITERKKLGEKLKKAAYYDVMTGLPNRLLIGNEMKQLIDDNIPFSLAHIDIDNFKQINDTLGHSVGDLFLQHIANKLLHIIELPNRVAKLSGDEFVVLFLHTYTKNELKKELERIIQELGKSWEYNHYVFFVSYSIGVVNFPESGNDRNTLLRNADIAMYKAKKEGKGRCSFYSDAILKDNSENIKLSNQLQYAIKNNELFLYYQPQFNIATGKITGLEALVRWIHPENGFIPPNKFIPIAEETGQIHEIEKWIIETALNQKKAFEQDGKQDITISINLSSKALASDINFQGIEALFASYDVDYSHITIEVTETAIIADIDVAVERLNKLKKLGMKIALDDFGTGYSSLTHLKDIPIDTVKLDRSFVKNIENDGKESIIIKAILFLAIDLGYEVVAEGIETEVQLDYLKKNNCKTGQGFLISRPLPIEEIKDKL